MDDGGSDRRRDEDELRALSTAYADAADARDGAAMAALFVADGSLVVPDYPVDLRPVVTRQGHEALERIPEVLRRYHRTFHLVGGTRYEVDGDRATGEVQCVAHHVTATDQPGGTEPDRVGTDTVWFIRYRDQYRRSGPTWRIVRRELHLQWVEEHPVALLGAPPGDRT
ncbi:MAG TPA: nuclear transport factor 2 family protein [Acidimicrobiales bacterium]|nr:nuclear transport factor 2 family protein [Acidimicrobiales bacterium]